MDLSQGIFCRFKESDLLPLYSIYDIIKPKKAAKDKLE